jgi:hypothetical protein
VECVPNPADQYVQIGDKSFLSQADDVHVYDAKGNQVSDYVLDAASGKIVIRNLSAGMYFVRVQRHGTTYLGRFVKVR